MNCINVKKLLSTVNKIQIITTQVVRKSTIWSGPKVVLNKYTPVADLHISFIRYLGDMAKRNTSTNRLALEKSPYLLQHAHNPVDWYPWGEEAFAKSLKENKLIFLSVGYSTCHWCHVMERESFENEEIAKVLNENFVCIKVDREERPDVDKLYMLFVQAYAGQCGWPLSVWLQPDLTPVTGGTYYPPHDQYGRPGFLSLLLILSKKVNTGRGGWPLSVWLTPKLQPIFGGTYFPPKDISGHPGFKSILMILAKQWRDSRQKFSESGQKVMDFIKESSVLDSTALDLAAIIIPDISCYKKCYDMLVKSFEEKYGGFGGAPKFPHLVNFNFLFHLYSQQPNSEHGKKALEMCIFSLQMMAKGAIHDHIGQGFARYCIDEKWHLPHFEKMLYDQAQFAVSFTSAYLATKDSFFSKVLEDVLLYVNRDLSHPFGGFYCAEDADSLPTPNSTEKKEGAFYVWTYEELKQILKQRVAEKPDLTFADVFCIYYNVRPNGNISSSMDSDNEFKNKNVLIVTDDERTTAEKMGISEDSVKVILEECKKIIFEHRTKRPRPHLDDKILTSWNGLMISGLAKAGQALGNSSYVQRAVGAAKFIRQYLYKNDSKTLLRSCYKDSDNTVTQITKPINGFLDDYAYVIRGLLDLYEASFDPTWIEWAETLQETQDRLFWDEGGAGYFSSPSGDSSILVRMKDDHDGVEPSGNSVSVHNLLRLGAYLDRNDCRERAGKLLTAFTSRLSKMPVTLPEMISGLMFFHDGPTQIIITGKPDAPDTAALLNVVHSRLIPNRVLVLVGEDKENILFKKNDIIKTIKSIGGRSTAYVCHHHTCSLPVTTREELAKHLDNPKIIIPTGKHVEKF